MLIHHIGEKRAALGLTQQQLADRIGWKLRKLTSFERRERIPSVDDAIVIANALNTTVESIWELKEETE